jgi:hypothetical protein
MDPETRAKISRTMKGHSNFEGHKHTHAEKKQIATSQEGHRNAAGLKWSINRNTGKETRTAVKLPQGNRWGRTREFKSWIHHKSRVNTPTKANESTLAPKDRFEGTGSLSATYAKDTPGQKPKSFKVWKEQN